MNKTPSSPTLSEMEFDHLDSFCEEQDVPAITLSSGVTRATPPSSLARPRPKFHTQCHPLPPPPPVAKANVQRPSPPIVPPPDQPIIIDPGNAKLKISPRAHTMTAGAIKPKKKTPGMTRYLLPKKDESFIGPVMPSQSEVIDLLTRECPSLAHLPPSAISLNLRFDGNPQKSVEGVLFRVLDQAWPGAIKDVLPLVHVKIRQTELDKVCEKAKQMQTNRQTESKHPELIPVAPIDRVTWDDLKKQGAALGIHGSEGASGGQRKPRGMTAMVGVSTVGWKDEDGTGSYHEHHGLLD
ncbi:hypothetical protein B9479_006155 [Cryptococcus floricola]|uniref:Uncharacterized protein n=1 Tax=Cryptococcus floricola TaxID=2591691 RepID=A0A5D3AR31_9TREE|nr:hypothetical protein B9479_006155 [Cryptococcus floricola]